MFEITRTKNSDYARKDEALANFKRFGALGVLVRISDKYERVFNAMWHQHKFLVDESLTDTVMDMAVYSIIMLVLLEEEEKDLKDKKDKNSVIVQNVAGDRFILDKDLDRSNDNPRLRRSS